MKAKYADIAVPLPITSLFTYSIPDVLSQSISPGMRVLVPFGKRRLTGYVVALKSDTSLEKIKPIEDVLDEKPAFSGELMELAQWISQYYLCSLGEVLKAMLPAGISVESERRIKLNPGYWASEGDKYDFKAETQIRIVQTVNEENELNFKQLEKIVGSRGLHYHVQQLVKKGVLEFSYKLLAVKVKPQYRKFVRLKQHYSSANEFEAAISQINPQAKKQITCCRILWEQQKSIQQSELLKQCDATSSIIKSLIDSKLIVTEDREVTRRYLAEADNEPAQEIILNPDQQQALNQILRAVENRQFNPFLLHGVTGSGKTQIYIDVLKKVISRGQGGIVLVPEISLTPQTVRRFRSNFPNQVAVLHSRMSQGERYDSWRKVKDGTYRVVVGARSAIFAPLKNPGLIVVDEEHEASYKQFETNPLYHARDVAVVRAKMNQAVVILGSATPAVESYYNALNKKYSLINLPRRIDDIPMPEVKIIDMMREHRVYGYEKTRVFSTLLRKKIEEKLERKEQIILLQNRRGYSPYLRCKKCGHIEQCIQCNITLTFHKRVNHLRCHYCGYTTAVPAACPKCGDKQIVFKGIGTQKVEEELLKIFPQARVVRMDLDTTQGKLAHDKIITSFGKGDYDILLGTQMVAKGLDFHRVTLVGVISADTGLFLPDFRAAERTFQLLTQVAGRAGRKSSQGEVIVQSYSPDHTCLLFARRHDFIGFYNLEEAARKELNYPPYGRLVSVLFKGKNEVDVSRAAQVFKENLDFKKHFIHILGPTPAPLTKVQNFYRWQIVIKSPKAIDPAGKVVRHYVEQAVKNYRRIMRDSKIKVSIDIDPMTLF